MLELLEQLRFIIGVAFILAS
ncbi:hypothetical protein Gotur_029344 [Gossypium turneri]